MPNKPLSPCHQPGCPKLAKSGSSYCELHKKQNEKVYDTARGTAAERGYDATWAKVRAIYLSQHPLCEECLKVNKIVPSKIPHHIKPIHKYPDLRLDMNNLKALCVACHNRIENRGNV